MTDRRNFISRGLAGASTLLLSGCYDLSQKPWFTNILGKVEDLTQASQHLFAGPHTLAPEFTKADIAPVFRANGTLDPGTPDYAAHVASNFKNWRVTVTGLVARPLSLSMDELRKLPARTQTRSALCHVLLRRSDDRGGRSQPLLLRKPGPYRGDAPADHPGLSNERRA